MSIANCVNNLLLTRKGGDGKQNLMVTLMLTMSAQISLLGKETRLRVPTTNPWRDGPGEQESEEENAGTPILCPSVA